MKFSPLCAARQRNSSLSCVIAGAIHWYERGVISQEKAAQIADLDRTDFLMALASSQVDVFAVDIDALKEELARG